MIVVVMVTLILMAVLKVLVMVIFMGIYKYRGIWRWMLMVIFMEKIMLKVMGIILGHGIFMVLVIGRSVVMFLVW